MPTITIKSDKPMVLISSEEFDSMREAIEILSDPELMKDIEEARKALREGRTISWDDLKKELFNED